MKRLETAKSAQIEAKPKEMPDYRERVLKMLTEEASWPSELAREIAKDESTEQESVKFAVSKALKTLQNDGLIARQMIKLKDKEVMLYYKRDSAMSGLHKFMEREVTKQLEEQGMTYELAKPGEDKPDIMTKEFDIEIETGLKHDLTEFERKLVTSTKKTYVVVPNDTEKQRFVAIAGARIRVMYQLDIANL
jgi:hypothetical protein